MTGYDELAELIRDREEMARRLRSMAALLAELDDRIDTLLEAERKRLS
jgi:hypothetical protein